MKSITEVVQNLLKPYIDRNIETATGVLGAKNLLPNNATSQTVNNVTYTVNSDGSVKVNGTANGNADLTLGYQIPIKQWFQKEGEYLLSFGDELDGQPQNEILSGYFAIFDSSTMQFQRWCTKTNPVQSFTITKEMIESSTTWIQCLVRVWSGKSVSNRTVYPMIRLASIEDDTYVPYAMTNKKITDAVQHNNKGGIVGYYATRTYQASELSNVSQGTIKVTNSNGVICITVTNLVCTPDVVLVDLSAYVGSGTYAYDNNGGSKMFIDSGRLFCKESNMGYRIFTFIS